MKIDWDTYRFRCHRLSDLMTNPKKATGELSLTTQSYLYKVYDEEINNISQVLKTKEIRKGLECEEDSIQLVNEVHSTFFSKNEEHYQNEYIQGTPDIVTPKIVVDIKTSWSMDTFRGASLSPANYWQMVGYLWLTGRKRGYVAYCLVDTPYPMVQDALRQLSWSMGMIDDTNPEYVEAAEKLEASMYYSHIDSARRVQCFPVDINQELIFNLKERVLKCRNFLGSIPKLEAAYGRIDTYGRGAGEIVMDEATMEHTREKAKEVVAEVFGVPAIDITNNRRTKDASIARHCFRSILMPFYQRVTTMAKDMNINHGTINNSLKEHKNLYSYDKEYRKKADDAERIFRRKEGR